MALTERDKRALMILCVAAPLIVIFFFGGTLLQIVLPSASAFAQKDKDLRLMYSKMTSFERWQKEMQDKQQALHVKVNADKADNQIDGFVKAMEDLGRRSQVQIVRYTQHERRTKKVAGGTVAYQTMQVDCAAQWPNLATFIKDIEAMTVPVVVDQIVFTKRTITTASSKSGGESRAPDGAPQGPGASPSGAPFPFLGGAPGAPSGPSGPGGKLERVVAGTLQLHIYLFPEGAEPAGGAKSSDKPSGAQSAEEAKDLGGQDNSKNAEEAKTSDEREGTKSAEGAKSSEEHRSSKTSDSRKGPKSGGPKR